MATPTVADDDEDEPENEPENAPEEEEVEDEEAEGGEEEEVETEEVDLPEDEEEDESSGGSLLAGETFGIPNTWLLGIGISAVVVVLFLRWASEPGASDEVYESQQEVEEEVQEAGGEEVEKDVTDAGGSKNRFDPQEQEAAVEGVFG